MLSRIPFFRLTVHFLASLATAAVSSSLAQVVTNRKFGALIGSKGTEDDCGAEIEAFVVCLPEPTVNCIFNAVAGVDMEDCNSIDSYCTAANACIDSSEHDCDTEVEEAETCLDTLEEEDSCPEACGGVDAVAAQVAAKLRGFAVV